MAVFLRLLQEKWKTLPTPALSLGGQTVLITGTNTGIGLEAAKKLAALQPKKLIITTRSISKGEQTMKEIQNHLRAENSKSATEIIPLTLDMGTLDGVETFVQDLKQNVDRLDGSILNAGITTPNHHVSANGYEDTLQVNTISTIYLAVLILPLLVSTAKSTSIPTHLTFISSRTAVRVPTASLPPYLSEEKPPLQLMSEASKFPPGFFGGQARYGESKLLLEYGMRNLVQSPILKDESGKHLVIINSVCPGVTRSDLGRSYDGWLLRFFVTYVFMPLLAKPAEQGAVCYLMAYSQGEESYGKLSGSGVGYVENWDALTAHAGQMLNKAVWMELVQIMQSRNQSSVAEILGPAS